MQMTDRCKKECFKEARGVHVQDGDLSPLVMHATTGLMCVLSANKHFFLLVAVKTMLELCFPLRFRKW